MSRRLATTDADTLPAAIDDAPDPETGPLRRCIITRESQPKERMIRFVIGPDRCVVPDLAARLPGRGIWLSARGDVLVSGGVPAEVQRNLVRAFARAARGQVTVPPNLPDLLEAALVRRITDTLGLARRAGQAVAGFDKAREWIRAGIARLIVQASDGSEAERARLISGSGDNVTVVSPLPAEVLGRIFARDHIVHVALSQGRLADSLASDAGRLAGLRQRDGMGRIAAPVTQEADANG